MGPLICRGVSMIPSAPSYPPEPPHLQDSKNFGHGTPSLAFIPVYTIDFAFPLG